MFDLKNKVVVITGGAGLLGQKHAEAVAQYGAHPVLLDIDELQAKNAAQRIADKYKVMACGFHVDITQEAEVEEIAAMIQKKYKKIDSLINNAANNPKIEAKGRAKNFTRLENFDVASWNKDIAVGLTGAFVCSKHIGPLIAENKKGGTIINVSSDLALISPDQRLYRKKGVAENQQEVKPVSYSVVKSGLLGLTKYLATYWADKNVRCNAICPGGVFNGQDQEFIQRLQQLIPLGRMAQPDEYKGIIVFLVSEEGSYMNGATLSMDGGRLIW